MGGYRFLVLVHALLWDKFDRLLAFYAADASIPTSLLRANAGLSEQAYGDEGYDLIDEAIRDTMNHEKRAVVVTVSLWGAPVVVLAIAWYAMYNWRACRERFWGEGAGAAMTLVVLTMGIAPARELVVLVPVLGLAALLFWMLGRSVEPLTAHCDGSFSHHSRVKRLFSFVQGFALATCAGLRANTALFLVVLAYTWFDRRPRQFDRQYYEWICFIGICLAWMVVRAFIHGNATNSMPLQYWMETWQAVPEAFYRLTECAAVVVLPLNMLWTCFLWWGLQVDWEREEHDDNSDDSESTDNERTPLQESRSDH
eukprot:TRINITY_DN5304_c0_g3_i1.p1 TRINITY_DN5304_c0_g3~~TRINITY_DN5304_c0_g3_i1.p1  ORF type:complete len:312 (-),score=37.43 TRINITY_DN5304_c0_g3_i1:35-970(-)